LPHIPTDSRLLIGAILYQQQWIVDCQTLSCRQISLS
jgi:hypothetical protein